MTTKVFMYGSFCNQYFQNLNRINGDRLGREASTKLVEDVIWVSPIMAFSKVPPVESKAVQHI